MLTALLFPYLSSSQPKGRIRTKQWTVEDYHVEIVFYLCEQSYETGSKWLNKDGMHRFACRWKKKRKGKKNYGQLWDNESRSIGTRFIVFCCSQSTKRMNRIIASVWNFETNVVRSGDEQFGKPPVQWPEAPLLYIYLRLPFLSAKLHTCYSRLLIVALDKFWRTDFKNLKNLPNSISISWKVKKMKRKIENRGDWGGKMLLVARDASLGPHYYVRIPGRIERRTVHRSVLCTGEVQRLIRKSNPR